MPEGSNVKKINVAPAPEDPPTNFSPFKKEGLSLKSEQDGVIA
ncbi:MAG: hypothetical protein WBD99_00490 [Thermodesulfobacteriota bacterium]